MNPVTFDQLVQKLKVGAVFHNNSSNEKRQISVDQQLFITLVQMGTYRNGASLSKIGSFCRIGKGTVDLITQSAITAIISSNLCSINVQWPVYYGKKNCKKMDRKSSSSLRMAKWHLYNR